MAEVAPGPVIAAVVIARDEEEMLPGCLRCLGFVEKVYVGVDSRTLDRTAEVAATSGAEVFPVEFTDFASAKSRGLEAVRADWVLFVDADERISRELAEEIVRRAAEAPDDVLGFRVPVTNYFHGQKMSFGGWSSEAPVRLVRTGVADFGGAVHETLRLNEKGRIEELRAPLIHFSHRSVEQALAKDWVYVDLGARRLLAEGAPRVTARHMMKQAAKLFFRRFVVKRAWKDGPAGVFDTIRVVSGELTTMMRLRELQQGYDPVAAYRELDEQLWGTDLAGD